MSNELELPDEPDLPDFWTQEGHVAAVDPADLQKVWQMFRDVEARNEGHRMSIDQKVFESVCSPGADVIAVWYRASMLGMLQMASEAPLKPWTHEGEFDDAVFQVAATFPIRTMRVGAVYDEPPFDVEGFVKQIGART